MKHLNFLKPILIVVLAILFLYLVTGISTLSIENQAKFFVVFLLVTAGAWLPILYLHMTYWSYENGKGYSYKGNNILEIRFNGKVEEIKIDKVTSFQSKAKNSIFPLVTYGNYYYNVIEDDLKRKIVITCLQWEGLEYDGPNITIIEVGFPSIMKIIKEID